MLSSLRTRLAQIEPPRVALTVRGRARLRVRGSAYGLLLCAGELRWVFGAFDETFQVQRTPELAIRALGLGGYARQSVRFLPGPDLSGPTIARRERLRWNTPRIPRLVPLSAATIFALAKDRDHDRT